MRTLQELQADFQQLEDDFQSLEKLPLNSNQLTVGDVAGLIRRLDSFKSDLSALASSQHSPIRPTAQQRNYRPFSPEPQPHPQRKGRITEENIGRYFVSALAAILMLLAVGLIACSAWEYIPSAIKFIAILFVGFLCEIIGWRKIKQNGKKNGFWTGLAGLGAATVFVDIISGALIWGLYPDLVAISGLILWFAAHILLARRANSNVFYVIAYFGGILAAALAFGNMGTEWQEEITVITITSILYAIGVAGAWKNENHILPSLNNLFLWAVFIQSHSIVSLPHVQPCHLHMTLSTSYVPVFLAIFQLCLSILLIAGTPQIWRKEWRGSRMGGAISSGLAALAVTVACSDIAYLFSTSLWMESFALCIICAAGIFHYKNHRGYILGAAPIVALLLANLSRTYLGYAPILPSLIALLCLVLPKIRKDKALRLTAFIFYFIAFLWMGDWSGINTTALYLGGLLLMAIPILNYLLTWTLNDSPFPIYELLASSILPAFTVLPYIDIYGGSVMICIVWLIVFSIFNRSLIPYRPFPMTQKESHIEHITFTIIAIVSVMFAYSCGFSSEDPIDLILVPLVLVICSVLSVCKAIRLSSKIPALLANIFCHFNMHYVIAMWESGSEVLLINCFGFLLAALFIAIGFWKKRKNIRICGLVFLIAYVLKIALLDTTSSGDILSRILGLLIGGAVCFIVSFAYNRLNKLFGDSEKQQT